MSSLKFKNIPEILNGEIILPASKSISNRVLMIKSLSPDFAIQNLSSADDTQLMLAALTTDENELFIRNAGTAMRFLTAYFAQSDKDVILKGDERMNTRPIAPLVEALNDMGAAIEYMEKQGFPPLHITGRKLKGGIINIRPDISSQFISALMLIAPKLENGLLIEFNELPVSMPYIEMTASVMRYFGIVMKISNRIIDISPQSYKSRDFIVESDWSSASYIYALSALKPGSEITFNDLFADSIQGDSIIRIYMEKFGVNTIFRGKNARISSSGLMPERFDAEMIDYPDLIPTMICLCAAGKIPFKISGTHTLKHKESDRAVALKSELGKFGIDLSLDKNSLSCENYPSEINSPVLLNTYNDHRLAMSFTMLAYVYPEVEIENPEEVKKSFPGFWDELGKSGFNYEVKN